MVRKLIFNILMLIAGFSLTANAQIGYQVALLNAADGQPRAFETVNVTVTLTDSIGTEIYKETKSTTSNEFGILSLSIGNSDMFNNMNWNNLPLYVSASVDGVFLGKSQVLNIPVAEYAKKTGILTKEILCSKAWRDPAATGDGFYTLIFDMDGTVRHIDLEGKVDMSTYFIWGNIVVVRDIGYNVFGPGVYDPDMNCIFFSRYTYQ